MNLCLFFFSKVWHSQLSAFSFLFHSVFFYSHLTQLARCRFSAQNANLEKTGKHRRSWTKKGSSLRKQRNCLKERPRQFLTRHLCLYMKKAKNARGLFRLLPFFRLFGRILPLFARDFSTLGLTYFLFSFLLFLSLFGV